MESIFCIVVLEAHGVTEEAHIFHGNDNKGIFDLVNYYLGTSFKTIEDYNRWCEDDNNNDDEAWVHLFYSNTGNDHTKFC